MKRVVRIFVAALALVCVFSAIPFQTFAVNSYETLIANLDYSALKGDYASYREYPSGFPDIVHVINGADFFHAEEMEPEVAENYEGQPGLSVITGSKGMLEWVVNIEEEGYYNIEVRYCAVPGNGADIKRSLFINGELPFKEAGYLNFKRVWRQASQQFSRDTDGNDIRPDILEIPTWQDVLLEDARGYVTEPFKFFFEAGENVITLLSQNEAMAVHHIKIYNAPEIPAYTAYKNEHKNAVVTKGQLIPVQAEEAGHRSSSMLYPFSEHSSPAPVPYDAKIDKINVIGGQNWREHGQWIEWEFEVAEAGFYNIAFYYLQNYVRGTYSARELSINGSVPFKEMQNIVFRYDNNFRAMVLGNGEEDYQFYFDKGPNSIRMKVVLGGIAELIYEAENAVADLNNIYRSVLMVTGKVPDANRDYQLASLMPGLEEELRVQHDKLVLLMEKLNSIAGKKSDKEALIQTLIDQLAEMIKDVEIIPGKMNSLKINIGGLGTWVTQAVNQPIVLDRIFIYSPDEALPKQSNGFFAKLIYEIKALFFSFVKNYDRIGSEQDISKDDVTVWIGTARDQANTIERLLRSGEHGAKTFSVNLMLAKMDTLLSATLAGQGPDVAMQLGNDLPMNFGMRDAVIDLSQFPDFNEVAGWFRESALTPFTFGDRVFALPETQTFNMMFYRKDILTQLRIDVPETWDDVKRILPSLNKNYLDFGLSPGNPEMSYGIFLYQNGGDFYKENGVASGLDSDIAVNAFNLWTSWYTEYGFEREFDFVNRFRTGEMPIGIADYTTYNNLQVAAPEIAGLWGIQAVPGTVRPDGSIDRISPSTGNAVVIMNAAKNKEASWEFLKWWTDAKIQAMYGNEMENLMGASARYPTANIEALKSLPWPAEDYNALSKQFESVRGIPQVPGGYFTSRHLTNAFYTVVINAKIGSREALADHVRYIDAEINNKRREFGLETMER